jgi:hypothetical protein
LTTVLEHCLNLLRIGESRLDRFQQIRCVEGFIKKRNGSFVEGSLSNLLIMVGGYEDDRQLWALQSHAALQLDSVHAWHPNIGDQTSRAAQRP